MRFNDYVKLEQAKVLSRQTRARILSNLVVGLTTVGALWQHFSHRDLLLWLSGVFVLAFCRWLSARAFTLDSTNMSNYKTRLKVIAFWFHGPSAPVYSLFLVCLTTAYVSIGAASTSFYLPTYFADYSHFFLRFVAAETELHQYIGYGVPFCIFIMTSRARVAAGNFRENKKLEFENTRLLDEVIEQKTIAEQAVIEKNIFWLQHVMTCVNRSMQWVCMWTHLGLVYQIHLMQAWSRTVPSISI